MTILNFDPFDCDNVHVCRLFNEGGPGLKFWLLWRPDHIVSQDFARDCLMLSKFYKPNQWEDVYKFWYFISENILDVQNTTGLMDWCVKHWDHFNPNIRRRVEYTYYIYGLIETRGIAE